MINEEIFIVIMVFGGPIAFVGLSLFSFICQWCVCWVDDRKIGDELTWFMVKLMAMWGYKPREEIDPLCISRENYPYEDDDSIADGYPQYFAALILSAFVPVLLYQGYKHWYAVIALGIFIGVMYLSRFSVRNAKMFKAHCEDKDAHNE